MSSHRILPLSMLSLALVAGCGDGSSGSGAAGGGGGGTGDGGASCPSGTQDADGDGTCQPDCSTVTCDNGSCEASTITGLAGCVCLPGYTGETCDALNAPNGDDLVFWVDAADPTTVIANDTTDAIISWDDKGDQGMGSTVDDPSLAPKLVEDALNGLPVARFDGLADYIYWTGWDGLNSSNSAFEEEYTIFLVASASGGGQTFFEARGGGDRVALDTDLAGLVFEHAPDTGATEATFETGMYGTRGFGYDDPHLITIERRAGSITFYVDGNFRLTKSTPGVDPIDQQILIALGSADGAMRELDGDIAEMLVATGILDRDTRVAYEDYLAAKWFGQGLERDVTAFGVATVWLDASADDSFNEVGGRVNMWENLGIEGGAFQNGLSEERRPERVLDQLGGLPVVRFDGDDALIQNALTTQQGLARDSYVVAAVVVPPATGSAQTLLRANATVSGDPGLRLGLLPDAGAIEYLHRWPAATSGGDSFTEDADLTSPILIVVVRTGASYRGQVGDATFSFTGSSDPDANIGGGQILNVLIGAEENTGNGGLVGDVAEVAFLQDPITMEEEAAFVEALREKWGL